MIPGDWKSTLARILDGEEFPKERIYLDSTREILTRTIPRVRMPFTPKLDAIPWTLFKAFVVARINERDLQGRVNLVIREPAHAAAFVHLMSAFLELAEQPIQGTAALTLASNERASWGSKEFSPPSVLGYSYIVLWEGDEIMQDYKHLAGVVSALDRVDDAKQGTIVISRFPFTVSKKLKSLKGESLDSSRMRLQTINLYEMARSR